MSREGWGAVGAAALPPCIGQSNILGQVLNFSAEDSSQK